MSQPSRPTFEQRLKAFRAFTLSQMYTGVSSPYQALPPFDHVLQFLAVKDRTVINETTPESDVDTYTALGFTQAEAESIVKSNERDTKLKIPGALFRNYTETALRALDGFREDQKITGYTQPGLTEAEFLRQFNEFYLHQVVAKRDARFNLLGRNKVTGTNDTNGPARLWSPYKHSDLADQFNRQLRIKFHARQAFEKLYPEADFLKEVNTPGAVAIRMGSYEDFINEKVNDFYNGLTFAQYQNIKTTKNADGSVVLSTEKDVVTRLVHEGKAETKQRHLNLIKAELLDRGYQGDYVDYRAHEIYSKIQDSVIDRNKVYLSRKENTRVGYKVATALRGTEAANVKALVAEQEEKKIRHIAIIRSELDKIHEKDKLVKGYDAILTLRANEIYDTIQADESRFGTKWNLSTSYNDKTSEGNPFFSVGRFFRSVINFGGFFNTETRTLSRLTHEAEKDYKVASVVDREFHGQVTATPKEAYDYANESYGRLKVLPQAKLRVAGEYSRFKIFNPIVKFFKAMFETKGVAEIRFAQRGSNLFAPRQPVDGFPVANPEQGSPRRGVHFAYGSQTSDVNVEIVDHVAKTVQILDAEIEARVAALRDYSTRGRRR